MSGIKRNDQIYSSDWLTDSDFVQWLVSLSESTKAKYKLCKNTFSLSNMGCQGHIVKYCKVLKLLMQFQLLLSS